MWNIGEMLGDDTKNALDTSNTVLCAQRKLANETVTPILVYRSIRIIHRDYVICMINKCFEPEIIFLIRQTTEATHVILKRLKRLGATQLKWMASSNLEISILNVFVLSIGSTINHEIESHGILSS